LGEHCAVIYAPLDFSWIARKFIRAINPVMYISAETEIWPNLYTALHRRGVPIVQVNGRISDKSLRGYTRVRFLIKGVLRCVQRFCMQSALDAERIIALGAQPDQVTVAGNLKFEVDLPAARRDKEGLGFNAGDRLWVAGSTHPGEEAILMDTYVYLKKDFEKLRLVIVPRHVERANDIIRLAHDKGLAAGIFSRWDKANAPKDAVMVADVIGHLHEFYQAAEIVFVGKSLTVGGGQNMIEPAALGKPTVVGPKTQNFKDIVKVFNESNALVQVQDSHGLYAAVKGLLCDPGKAGQIGEAARRAVEQQQGATERNMRVIREILSNRGRP